MPRTNSGWVIGLASAGLWVLAGCASPSAESVEEDRVARDTGVEERRSESARDAQREERSERSERGERAERTERTAARGATGGSESDSDQAKLVADLNEASRELASLRAAYARLKAEKGATEPAAPSRSAAASSAAKSDPTDEKIAAALKSYTTLKQELASIVTELERAKAERADAAAKLKDVSSRTDDSRATIARLERELKAEKEARLQAERSAAKVQEQLRTVAKALANAGLSVDKLAGGDR